MFPADQYELLDFGHGRKLECLGGVLVDRPSPVAAGHKMTQAALWNMARARFSRRDAQTGVWSTSHDFPATWLVRRQKITLELKPTPSGAVGLYPEQAANWDWIGDRIRTERHPVKVLNLFAYTGGSTLAAAEAGADEVVHVDAARGVVAWARRNARLSDLIARPIRWIVEDSRKFVERELRRGNAYQGIILDPPSYGHGPCAQAWKLDQHLEELLRLCGRLTRDRLAFILLTCHDPAWGPARLAAQLAEAVPDCSRSDIDAGSLTIQSRDGRHLPSGAFARWPR